MVDKAYEFAVAFEKFCAAEGMQVDSTMSDTKAVFAKCTLRSLKFTFYRYKEDFGYKYIHKLPQFITNLNSRPNRSIHLRPNTVTDGDFMSILYSKHFREYRKPTMKAGVRMRISNFDLPFREGYEPQFTRELFEMLAIATRKPPTYTIKGEPDEIIQDKFYQKKGRLKSFNKRFVYNTVGF